MFYSKLYPKSQDTGKTKHLDGLSYFLNNNNTIPNNNDSNDHPFNSLLDSDASVNFFNVKYDCDSFDTKVLKKIDNFSGIFDFNVLSKYRFNFPGYYNKSKSDKTKYPKNYNIKDLYVNNYSNDSSLLKNVVNNNTYNEIKTTDNIKFK